MSGSVIFAALACSQLPAESVIRRGCGGEVCRAVRHVDQVRRMQRTRERRQAWTGNHDGVDIGCSDMAVARGVGGGLSDCVVGMAARHELDRHVSDNVPAFSQALQRRGSASAAIGATERFEEPAPG